MLYFHTRNHTFGAFLEALEMNVLVHVTVIRYIFNYLVYVYCGHLVYFVVVWCVFTNFGIFYHGSSGNPVTQYVGCTYLLIRFFFWTDARGLFFCNYQFRNLRSWAWPTPGIKIRATSVRLAAPRHRAVNFGNDWQLNGSQTVTKINKILSSYQKTA
jgi:hypothetical protein